MEKNNLMNWVIPIELGNELGNGIWAGCDLDDVVGLYFWI